VTAVLRSLRSPGTRVVFFVAIGLVLIAGGFGAVWSGELFYLNYWGGRVFGPFAIMLGAALLLIVVSKLRRKFSHPAGPDRAGQHARRTRRLQKRRRRSRRFGS
jgi:hypothetical protein